MAVRRNIDSVEGAANLKGVDDLIRTLSNAPKRAIRKNALKGLRSAANTPRREMRAKMQHPPTQKMGQTSVQNAIAIRTDKKAPVMRPAVYVGLVKDYFYLFFHEYGSFLKPGGYGPRSKGTKYLKFKGQRDGKMVYAKKRDPVPATPWFRPGWKAAEQPTGQKIIDLTQKALDREIRKEKRG